MISSVINGPQWPLCQLQSWWTFYTRNYINCQHDRTHRIHCSDPWCDDEIRLAKHECGKLRVSSEKIYRWWHHQIELTRDSLLVSSVGQPETQDFWVESDSHIDMRLNGFGFAVNQSCSNIAQIGLRLASAEEARPQQWWHAKLSADLELVSHSETVRMAFCQATHRLPPQGQTVILEIKPLPANVNIASGETSSDACVIN